MEGDFLERVTKDPLLNLNLVHPDSPTFKERLLAEPLLRSYYRPDLYRGLDHHITKKEVEAAITRCRQDLAGCVLWRTAYNEGVCGGRKSDEGEIGFLLCAVLFSRV